MDKFYKLIIISLLSISLLSCSQSIENAQVFIATNDLGYSSNGGFDIIGRGQNSTQRGCNLMI